MLVSLLAYLQASPPVAPLATVLLSRGVQVYGSGVSASYQDVEDTVLDRNTPDTPHGGDYTLLAGEGRTLLIRFGSLGTISRQPATVVEATLTLTLTSGAPTTLGSIGVVTRSWGEGPFLTVGGPTKPGVEPPKDFSEAFAATWRSRFSGLGGCAWRSAGAVGADVRPVSGAKGVLAGNRFQITGLAPAVNALLSDPGANHGFALTFSSEAEFYSSESSVGKPVLQITLAPRAEATKGDVVVDDIVPAPGGYVAHLHNQGSEAVDGLHAAWSIDGQSASTETLATVIAPGARHEVKFASGVRAQADDHRFGALTLRISTGAADTHLADKQLTAFTAGVPISALVTRDVLSALAGTESARGLGASNWVQSQFDFVNEVVLARSRYSFAPDGCRERVRLAELKEIGPLIDVPAPIGVAVEVQAGAQGIPALDFGFIRRVLIAIGAPDLSIAEYPIGSPKVKLAGWNVGGASPYPDLTGGGDTRYEGSLARQSLLPEVPMFDSVLTAPGVEPTGLLSASAVGILDSLLKSPPSGRAAARAELLSALPTTILMSVSDASGVPLKNAELSFFQSTGGSISDVPVFTASTGETGSLLLPKRAVPGSQTKNAFGSRQFPQDGSFLVRATVPGGTGWGWLKSWQLSEAACRGDTEFASVPLNVFMTANSIDRSVNRAVGRVVADSSGTLPSKLAPLVDGQGKTEVSLPEKAGNWIEVDLNRDWNLAELRLTSLSGSPWRRFAVKVYQTGQKPENAVSWFSEADWDWSANNRGARDGTGRVTVVYDALPVQIRYIRIVCLEAGPATLGQIEAFSARSSG